ncbi:MAG: hypothetical protein AAB091_03905 [Elusimicrobiota bacterium]
MHETDNVKLGGRVQRSDAHVTRSPGQKDLTVYGAARDVEGGSRLKRAGGVLDVAGIPVL